MLVKILDEQALKNQKLLHAVRWLRSIEPLEFFLLNDAVWFIICIIWCLWIEAFYRLRLRKKHTPDQLNAVNKRKNEKVVIPVVACALGNVFTSLAVLYATSSAVIILQATGFLLLEMCVILPLFLVNDKQKILTIQDEATSNVGEEDV